MNLNKEKIIATAATALIAILITTWMVTCSVSAKSNDTGWPPKHDSEIVLDDYAELFDYPTMPTPAAEKPSAAENEAFSDANAEASPLSGMDVDDIGHKGDAARPVTTEREAEVKTQKNEIPKKEGPKEDAAEKAREEARRKAANDTKSAFQRSDGKNNTNNVSAKPPGNAGSPTGTSSAVNGRGTGRAGGGWSLPQYAPVASTVTGKIEMTVKIDRTGRVTSVTFTGGTPPAATNRQLREAVEKEVRSRNFTRGDNKAPDEATAYITYTFK